MDFTYEYEFENLMMKYFSEKYSLRGKKLQQYLILRYMIINNQKDFRKITLEEFSEFIAKEMGITGWPTFTYKGSSFSIASEINQSISNIISNTRPVWWTIWGGFSTKADNYCNTLFHSLIANLPVKIRRNKTAFKKYMKDAYLLGELNSEFGVEPVFTRLSDVEELDMGMRTYEEVCEANVSAMTFDSTDSSLVLEKDIEEFMYSNLKTLLNCTPVQRQYQIADDCIADIFARDESEMYIIEIKNTKDQRLLFQLVNYHKHMPKAHIVAASTTWDKALLEEVLKLGYVRAFELKPHVFMGKIDRLDIKELL